MDINLVGIVDSVTALAKQRDEALAKYDELQEAARALLEAMPFDMSVCPKCRGNVLATKVCRFDPPIAGSWFACDEHATPGAMDSRTAPHVRRLRALLVVEAASHDEALVKSADRLPWFQEGEG